MNKTKKRSEKIMTITTMEKRTVMIKRILITLDNAATKSAKSFTLFHLLYVKQTCGK